MRTDAFKPFVAEFLDGVQLALVVAVVLTLVAGAIAAVVREPAAPVEDADDVELGVR